MPMNTPLCYYVGFSMVPGIGPARLERLISACGSVEAAWNASLADIIAAGLERKFGLALLHARQSLDLDQELAQAAAKGIQMVCREDHTFPAALAHIPSPPPIIYYRGTLVPDDNWSVAIVGTRSPTSYGREAARRLAGELASQGVTIVSGLALGIDTIAHTAALEAGGRTLAVLANGADMVYPERNQRLAERVMGAGAILSEFPIGTRPLPQLFPVRNRLISGLTKAVIVVEARLGSGAMITVDYALEQGRDVFAVPGPIYSPASAGPHQLLRQGAGIATCAQDILEALGANLQAPSQSNDSDLPDDPDERFILALLSQEPQHIDELCRTSGWTIDRVAAALTFLELKGLIRQTGPMEYLPTSLVSGSAHRPGVGRQLDLLLE
jgi:DNA processing protein